MKKTIPHTQAHEELVLNLSLQESLLRGLTAILIPMFLLLIDVHLIPFALPVILYLYITCIVHICPLKRVWHEWIEGRKDNDTNTFWDRG